MVERCANVARLEGALVCACLVVSQQVHERMDDRAAVGQREYMWYLKLFAWWTEWICTSRSILDMG